MVNKGPVLNHPLGSYSVLHLNRDPHCNTGDGQPIGLVKTNTHRGVIKPIPNQIRVFT